MTRSLKRLKQTKRRRQRLIRKRGGSWSNNALTNNMFTRGASKLGRYSRDRIKGIFESKEDRRDAEYQRKVYERKVNAIQDGIWDKDGLYNPNKK